MIVLRRRTLAWIPGFLLLSLYLLGTSSHLSAAETRFILEESLPLKLPDSYSVVMSVQDMDDDGLTDILVLQYRANRLTMMERSGNQFVKTWTHQDSRYRRGGLTGNLDGDQFPDFTYVPYYRPIKVFESDDNDSYVIRQELPVGLVEGYRIGDSDGNGILEIIAAAEWGGVSIFESDKDNHYKLKARLPGRGDMCLAGARDLDGDGKPETVYTDYCAWNRTPKVHVYEAGKRVCCDKISKMMALALGDTDGNGLGEVIGYGPDNKTWRVFESTGSGNEFKEVMNRPSSKMPYSLGVADYDGDGQDEHIGIRTGVSGFKDFFVLAHRSGDQLIDFYSSEEMFQSFDGDIKQVRVTEPGKLAVVQGNYLHLLSMYRNTPPVAVAGSDIELIVGEMAYFDGSGSYDEDGNIVDYAWLIDNNIMLAGEQASYLFTMPGVHTVTLTVTDNEGATASDLIGVSVLTPSVAMYVLMAKIAVLDLPKGIETSLTTKVNSALGSVDNPKTCGNKLGAFINQLKALTGKKLAPDDAAALTDYATRIIAAL